MGMLDWLRGKKASPPSEYLDAGPPTPPSREDLARAIAAGVGYGQPTAPFVEGNVARRYTGRHPITETAEGGLRRLAAEDVGENAPALRDEHEMYAAGQVAANRSAVAGLGYDPRQFNLDARPIEDGERVNLGGLYVPKQDMGWVSRNLEGSNNPFGSTLAHESMHRGIKKMRADPEYGPLVERIIPGHTSEEDMVRALVNATYGKGALRGRGGNVGARPKEIEEFRSISPTERWDNAEFYKGAPQRIGYAERPNRMALIEALAAEMVAKRRPGGPR